MSVLIWGRLGLLCSFWLALCLCQLKNSIFTLLILILVFFDFLLYVVFGIEVHIDQLELSCAFIPDTLKFTSYLTGIFLISLTPLLWHVFLLLVHDKLKHPLTLKRRNCFIIVI